MKLTEEQIKKRGKILQEMADIYWIERPYLTRDEAYKIFGQELEQDHIKQRVLNALAAAS